MIVSPFTLPFVSSLPRTIARRRQQFKLGGHGPRTTTFLVRASVLILVIVVVVVKVIVSDRVKPKILARVRVICVFVLFCNCICVCIFIVLTFTLSCFIVILGCFVVVVKLGSLSLLSVFVRRRRKYLHTVAMVTVVCVIVCRISLLVLFVTGFVCVLILRCIGLMPLRQQLLSLLRSSACFVFHLFQVFFILRLVYCLW
mmetsp:Transcript_26281/g.42969  ORF Transcript_26281/g.42969 Transcript_26281/m.42969 type:complete len:200 (-) Transcript_26281:112-711(-)